MSRPQKLGGFVNSRANTTIGITAANIADQRIIYVVVGWLSVFTQEGDRRHDLARLAVAALRHIEFGPGRLNDFRDLSGYALDGHDTTTCVHLQSCRCTSADRQVMQCILLPFSIAATDQLGLLHFSNSHSRAPRYARAGLWRGRCSMFI